jgi:hypothetical protein
MIAHVQIMAKDKLIALYKGAFGEEADNTAKMMCGLMAKRFASGEQMEWRAQGEFRVLASLETA